MAIKRKRISRYSKVQVNGYEYYKTDIEDAEGKRVILYGKTREELYEKELAALEQVDSATFRRTSPTVAEYCEKWLLMQSVHVRATTLTDYTSKVRRHAPYLTVRRAWHTEHNRPVILTELKTKAAERNIPLPDCLAECLKEAKKKSTSDYVVANRDGEPLSYTQFKRLWQYIVTRTAKPRKARKLVDGKYVNYMLYPKLGEKARNNGHVVYSLDFEVTPHMLRHTYITNLIHSSVDPKTVQYLAGHESSKITMDIYAKAKYNRPDELAGVLNGAFALWDANEYEIAQ